MKIDERLLEGDCPVIVGVSGGADSLCLLLSLQDLANERKIPLYACHVEHGIRGEASRRDQLFVRKLCQERGIPLYEEAVDAPAYAKKAHLGLEEAARACRRQAYARAAEHFAPGGAVRVALAHHAVDNAETVLLNLIRGTGIRGLRGMEPETPLTVEGREVAGVTVIRPLLGVTRLQIEEDLRERGITWREDTTNADETYSRNAIRNSILPRLCAINERAVEHINAAAQDVSRLYAAMDLEAEEAFGWADSEDGLSIAAMAEMDSELRRRVLERWLSGKGGVRDITRRHYAALQGLIAAGTGKGIDLPGRRRVEVVYGNLCLVSAPNTPETQPKEAELEKPAVGESLFYDFDALGISMRAFPYDREGGICKKSYAKWFDYDKIYTVILRKRREGDFLTIDRGGSRKSLRRLLIDGKVPKNERDSLPVLAQKGESDVIWVVGVRESMSYHVTEHTRTVLEIAVTL